MTHRLPVPRLLVGGAALLAMCAVAVGEEPGSGQTNVDGCRRNLQLIHDALGTYQRMNGSWPRRLSDLAGQYVAPEVLICPQCVQRRVFRVRDLDLLNIAQADSQTVYKWELNTMQEAVGVADKTWLDWKKRQRLTAVGDAVPMVRCDQHEISGEMVHLNLSFGGDVYISGAYWEEVFRDLLAMPYLSTPRQVFAAVDRIPARVAVRPMGATPRHIDLGPMATALPGDPWQDGTSTDTMASLVESAGSSGLWVHQGIGFDVRALVQLDGRRLHKDEKVTGRNELFYPTQPVSIPVGLPGHRLHVLGGAVFAAPVGEEIGGLIVTYSGGAAQRIPWRYGVDVRDGWTDSVTGQEETHLAWTADGFTPEVPGVPKRTGPLKVYHLVADLERPNETIQALEFFSSATHPDPAKRHVSGPFLLAVTLE